MNPLDEAALIYLCAMSFVALLALGILALRRCWKRADGVRANSETSSEGGNDADRMA